VRASAHAAPTTTLIANLRPQSQVTVYGMVRSIGTVRVGAGLAYHFTLVDGSGELDVLLTGQPDIESLQPSTRIFAEGTLGSYDSKLALWNPSYTIEPAK
jgi:cytochrome c-type biogenesis protein CcmE